MIKFVCTGIIFAARNGRCTGNFMRAIIWSRGISQVWKLHLLCHDISHDNLLPSVSPMDIHGQTPRIRWPRPFDLTSRWQILRLPHPCAIWLRSSSVIGSLLPGTELDTSDARELMHSFMSACTSLLGSDIQAATRKRWCSISHRHYVLAQCRLPWTLHEVLFRLRENTSQIYQGRFHSH